MNTDEALNSLVRHLRALWRAEMLIVEIKVGSLTRKIGLVAVAGLIGIFGLATLNFAAYRALEPLWGDVLALVAVAVADFVIAAILVMMASSKPKESDIVLATELRDQALAGLELDTRVAVDEVTGFVRRPVQLAGSLSSIIASIVAALLRRRRGD